MLKQAKINYQKPSKVHKNVIRTLFNKRSEDERDGGRHGHLRPPLHLGPARKTPKARFLLAVDRVY